MLAHDYFTVYNLFYKCQTKVEIIRNAKYICSPTLGTGFGQY